jgi:DNA-binding cell septation regulator SpoVG
MLTIREKLNMKTMRIEEIKDTLKRSQLLTRGSIGAIKDITGGIAGVAEEDVIDEVIKEYENQEEEAEADATPEDEDEEEAGDPVDEDDDDDDDGMDNGLEEVDPQVMKLQERIKFLRHRCISSLGNQIFDKAYATF